MPNLDDQFSSRGETDLGQSLSSFSAPEMSERDYAEHAANLAARVIENTGLVEIVNVVPSNTQFHLLARVKPENENRVLDRIVYPILDKAVQGTVFEAHICKTFFKKNGKRRYGWNFSITASDLREAVQQIGEVIDEMIPKKEVLEAPLMGPNPPMGALGGSRGASPVRG